MMLDVTFYHSLLPEMRLLLVFCQRGGDHSGSKLRSFEFDDKYFRDFPKFSNFINSVLFPRNSIQSVRLTCGFSNAFTLEGFDFFLYGLVLKGIQELHLQLVTSKTILPYRFYGCKTLVTLKLNNVTLNCSSYDFPLLKYLNLIQVKFESHSVMFKFFCACPNVEDLDARSLTIVGGKIPSSAEEGAEVLPKLITANISQFFGFKPLSSYIPFHALREAQFLRARMVKFCLLLSNICLKRPTPVVIDFKSHQYKFYMQKFYFPKTNTINALVNIFLLKFLISYYLVLTIICFLIRTPWIVSTIPRFII